MTNLVSHLRELKAKLEELRPLLTGTVAVGGYLEFFDEFVREQEFDLALHMICDFVIDENVPQIDPAVVERIRAIHQSMQIQDDCVERIKAKFSQ
jgi:hypothetical protein